MQRLLAAMLIALAAAVPIAAAPGAAAAARSPRLAAVLAGPRQATIGTAVALRVRMRVPRGRRIVRFTLRFGDGATLKGRRLPRSVRHVYRKAASITARLTVVDSTGARASARRRIIVVRPVRGATSPPASPTPPSSSALPRGGSSGPTAPAAAVPLDLTAAGLQLAPGSMDHVALPSPLVAVTTIDPPAALPPELSVRADDDTISVVTTMDAQPMTTALTVVGRGCTATACDQRFSLRFPVTVRGLVAPVGDRAFTMASPERIAAGTPLPIGGVALRDELIVTLGTPDSPGTRGQADAAAAAAGGVVSGGLEDIGVYEVRWTSPQDLALRRNKLLAQRGVTAVSDSTMGVASTNQEPPGDWANDDDSVKWPFIVTRTRQAWDLSHGSDVKVGIVDEGQVFGLHEDLTVIERIGANEYKEHATHVAGLACADANGIGVVGFAWSCPIISSGWNDGSDKGILQAAWAVAGQGAKVINISLGYATSACATEAEQQQLVDYADRWKLAFRQLFRGPVGRDTVWTIAAGNNCAPGAPSPWGVNGDLPNVITVAAMHADGGLTSFSDFGAGVEVAAPGGYDFWPYGSGSLGMTSTLVKRCFLDIWCSSYGQMVGTSMAAPTVAGVAALVRSRHPAFGASRAAGCITGSAGEGVGSVTQRSENLWRAVVPFTGSIPRVNAEAAVRCISLQFDGSPSAGPPPATLGGYPMTRFGADGRPAGLNRMVFDVPDPAGTIGFSPALEHLIVPTLWRTWSNGYQGDVYDTVGWSVYGASVRIDLPAGTKAFAFYAEPNVFGSFTVEAIAQDGTSSEPIDIQGENDARYFGFYGVEGRTLESITVSASDPAGFAIGEFGISR